MIYKEEVTINGVRYKKTYSDTHYIEREGVQYAEAIDPINSNREYVETAERLPENDLTAEQALETITRV